MKSILVLGSTGSVGQSTLNVIKKFKEKFHLIGLVANKRWKEILKQIKEYSPEVVALIDKEAYSKAKKELFGNATKLFCGIDGALEIIHTYKPDIVLSAISGANALLPTLEAIKLGRRVANANKEVLVMAGDIIMNYTKKYRTEFIPVDSEHNAIFQLLLDHNRDSIARIILTASGGPLFRMEKVEFEKVKPADALAHPVWNMGPKITIDSATMINKAFEIVEAKWLFGIDADKIDVIVHPQSIIHSIVEFSDGVCKALLACPDMQVPILYALTYPQRLNTTFWRIDFTKLDKLSFERICDEKFPSISIGYMVAREGGTLGAVFVGSDEVAVDAFLNEEISLPRIYSIIQEVIDKHENIKDPSLEEITEAYFWSVSLAKELIKK